jgi:hypothetical protein
MNNLKPCPFCGCDAELCYGPGLGTDSCRGYTLYASCSECSAKSPGLWQEKKPEPSDPIWDDVAAEWNCRPGEIDATKCGVAYCEHHPEGLPVCSRCREESTLVHDKAGAELAEARARIDHLERIVDEMTEEQAALCAEDQSITELVAAKDKQLAEARAEIERLEKARVFWRNKCEYEESEAGKAMINYVCQEQKKNKLIEQMVGALNHCKSTFKDYVEIHKAKMPVVTIGPIPPKWGDIQRKIARNQEAFDLCNAALSAAERGE